MNRNLGSALLYRFRGKFTDDVTDVYGCFLQIRDSTKPRHILVVHSAANSNLDLHAVATSGNRDPRVLDRFDSVPPCELDSVGYAA